MSPPRSQAKTFNMCKVKIGILFSLLGLIIGAGGHVLKVGMFAGDKEVRIETLEEKTRGLENKVDNIQKTVTESARDIKWLIESQKNKDEN